jgi:hypothetical protein
MKNQENDSVQLHTIKEAIKTGYELIGKYLPSNYKERIKQKHPKVDLDVLEKVRYKNFVAKNYLTEFNYLVELSKAQEKDLNYLNELVKL